MQSIAVRNRKLTRCCAGGVAFILLACGQFYQAEAKILSSKRGFSDVGASYNYLQATGAGWYYTWGLGAANPGNFDASFAPMFWGGWAVNQGNIDAAKNNPNVEWVLGFNEPERTDQANMTVAQAIADWTTLSNGFSGSGKKLVSPAVSDTGGGQAWISDFMTQANNAGLQVDAVGFHWYGVSNPNNPAGAASSFISRMNWYHQWGLPVFVTEFAIHDWGGAYSNEEIIEANRQFLDIVVPWMESTSWVEGYSFYPWFSDGPLWEGNPVKPTRMAYEYTGVVESGESEDVGGQDLGEHVAFLAGGELTMTGSPGTVRYIRAMEGASSITGSVDWGLNNTTNWARVESGATLRKTGSNTITWAGIDATNHGRIEVSSGTLKLNDNVDVSGSGTWRVKAGGTLQVDGTSHDTFGTVDFPVQLQGGELTSTMSGGLLVNSGTTLSGSGTVSSDLIIYGGSTLQVGGAGLNIQKGGGVMSLVEDFEGYSAGNANGGGSNAFELNGGPWTINNDGATSFVAIEDDSINQQLAFGWNAGQRGASRSVTTIADGDAGTYYFQILTEDASPDVSYGLSDLPSGGTYGYSDFEVQIGLVNNGGPTLGARNGGTFEQLVSLSTNTWYDIWLVVDNDSDTFDAYYGTSGDPNALTSATLFADDFSFRNGVNSNDLVTFMTLSNNHEDLNAHLDNIFQSSLPPGPPIISDAATFTVQSDLLMVAGTKLALDLYDPNVHDLLDVQGQLTAGGTLQLNLDPNAPALLPGDTFDILNFVSSTGAFETLSLPILDAGLVWNVTDLYSSGELSVVTDVDLDDDGLVTLGDFLLIQRTDPSLIPEWETFLGSSVVTGTNLVAAVSSVPEPACFTLLIVTAASILSRRTLSHPCTAASYNKRRAKTLDHVNSPF